MAKFKLNILFSLLFISSLIVFDVSAEVERFEFTIGPGQRNGEASLAVQPNFEAKQTYVDFKTRQVGVSSMDTIRIAI